MARESSNQSKSFVFLTKRILEACSSKSPNYYPFFKHTHSLSSSDVSLYEFCCCLRRSSPLISSKSLFPPSTLCGPSPLLSLRPPCLLTISRRSICGFFCGISVS